MEEETKIALVKLTDTEKLEINCKMLHKTGLDYNKTLIICRNGLNTNIFHKPRIF